MKSCGSPVSTALAQPSVLSSSVALWHPAGSEQGLGRLWKSPTAASHDIKNILFCPKQVLWRTRGVNSSTFCQQGISASNKSGAQAKPSKKYLPMWAPSPVPGIDYLYKFISNTGWGSGTQHFARPSVPCICNHRMWHAKTFLNSTPTSHPLLPGISSTRKAPISCTEWQNSGIFDMFWGMF